MTRDKVKVLYIAGQARIGSTIVGNILGEIDHFFHTGEVYYIWNKDLGEEWQCGCGVDVHQCEIWSAVLAKAFHILNETDVAEMITLRGRIPHSRSIPKFMLIPGARPKLKSNLEIYLGNLEKLYHGIKDVTASNLVVDSSKRIGYAHVLKMIPTIDLYVLHLVRDPRATAYSWLRKKKYLPGKSPTKSSMLWNTTNFAIELSRKNWPGKYLRIHYEDFVVRPRKTVERILGFVGEQPSNLPFLNESEVSLGVNHCIHGNPNRFETGTVKLNLDERWKQMNTSEKRLVTVLTWPLLIKYGYSLNPQ